MLYHLQALVWDVKLKRTGRNGIDNTSLRYNKNTVYEKDEVIDGIYEIIKGKASGSSGFVK